MTVSRVASAGGMSSRRLQHYGRFCAMEPPSELSRYPEQMQRELAERRSLTIMELLRKLAEGDSFSSKAIEKALERL